MTRINELKTLRAEYEQMRDDRTVSIDTFEMACRAVNELTKEIKQEEFINELKAIPKLAFKPVRISRQENKRLDARFDAEILGIY